MGYEEYLIDACIENGVGRSVDQCLNWIMDNQHKIKKPSSRPIAKKISTRTSGRTGGTSGTTRTSGRTGGTSGTTRTSGRTGGTSGTSGRTGGNSGTTRTSGRTGGTRSKVDTTGARRVPNPSKPVTRQQTKPQAREPVSKPKEVMNPFASSPQENVAPVTETTAHFTKTRYEHYKPKNIQIRDGNLKIEKKKSPEEIEREAFKEKERLRKKMLVRA